MSYGMGTAILLTLSSTSNAFYQGYLIPKLIAFCALTLFCTLYLSGRRELVLPGKKVLLFSGSYVGWALLLTVSVLAPLSSFYYVLLIIGIWVLYITCLNLEEQTYLRILYAVVISGTVQTIFAYIQFFKVYFLLPTFLKTDNDRIIGTVGNPEFLATLMGFSIFALLHLRTQSTRMIPPAFIFLGTLFLFSGILMTQSKGTLAFLVLFAIWKISRNIKLTAIVATVGAVFTVFLFPDSVVGRLFLWMSGFGVILSQPWWGVGPRQFANHYLESVHGLLSGWPWLTDPFGSYTGHVLDGHNIFLNHWAELGIPGLVASIVFIVYSLRLCRANPNFLAAGILFLIYKSLYTVMLNSLTGAILYAIALAGLSPKTGLLRLPWTFQTALPTAAYILMLGVFTAYMSLSDFHHQEGLKHLYLSNVSKAEEHFKRAQWYDPESSNAYLALANVSYQNNQIKPMKKFIDQALYYEKSMDTYKISAHMLFFRGQYQEALPLYEYINVAFPTHLTTMGKLALIHLKQGNRQRAEELANKLLNTRTRVKNLSDERNYDIARYVLNHATY